ncbi:uncharacterized protein LOC131935515 [Physella acuta]|uniref:uncharacterized protein LOC131935515 n=1 Tax=Physella acuta TaxID=109671 RepID=UPI0027DE9949|nr:uncharacterized protein LOC131935515 [Physella acuta]XP_059147915.1 uncharacterized protein LOC131935515 [Physella acuta]
MTANLPHQHVDFIQLKLNFLDCQRTHIHKVVDRYVSSVKDAVNGWLTKTDRKQTDLMHWCHVIDSAALFLVSKAEEIEEQSAGAPVEPQPIVTPHQTDMKDLKDSIDLIQTRIESLSSHMATLENKLERTSEKCFQHIQNTNSEVDSFKAFSNEKFKELSHKQTESPTKTNPSQALQDNKLVKLSLRLDKMSSRLSGTETDFTDQIKKLKNKTEKESAEVSDRIAELSSSLHSHYLMINNIGRRTFTTYPNMSPNTTLSQELQGLSQKVESHDTALQTVKNDLEKIKKLETRLNAESAHKFKNEKELQAKITDLQNKHQLLAKMVAGKLLPLDNLLQILKATQKAEGTKAPLDPQTKVV